MERFLKYINSIPFQLTVKHYYPLKRNLDSKESWDILRRSHPHFSISEDRGEWLEAAEGKVKKDGQDGGFIQRAREITELIDKLGIKSVFSVGVGGAGLEYQIKKAKPELKLICSEYSPVAVERLKKVFVEADSIVPFDMREYSWQKFYAVDLVLMYRIDIELTNNDFLKMFKKMHEAGIKNILIIICGHLTLRGLLNRFYQRFWWKIGGTNYAFAGHLRTIATFPPFWKNLYTGKELYFGGLKGFLLRKTDSNVS